MHSVFASHRLRKIAQSKDPIRLVVGANSYVPKDWAYSDIEVLDITNSSDWEKYFIPNSISAVLAEHVWEHLTEAEGILAIQLCQQYLISGGRLRIAVPDALHPDPAYHDHASPRGSRACEHGHKVFYDVNSLSSAIAACGLRPSPLEWFDSEGNFHFKEWSACDGMVRRSSRFDRRNLNSSLAYTSLIIDGIKN